MKLKINKDKCLGCGMCVGSNSDVFDFDDDSLATVNNDNINEENEDQVMEIANSCPVGAIEQVDENKED